jgi:peptidoglycan/xylan/chitin deacetylase (PgdA/CDA1 family)
MDTRIDRLTTLYLVGPLRRLRGLSEGPIPVLMYHSIADEPQSDGHAYFRTTTSPRMFAEQMAILHEEGYSVVGLPEAIRYSVDSITKAGTKKAVITFDDGFRDFYTDAFPVLRRYGFTALMFLPTSYIQETRARFKGKECMTWTEVRELQRHGVVFGSHTVSHPKLYGLDAPTIRRELVDSRRTIEQALGHPVQSFAYPYAFPSQDKRFKRQFRHALCEAGYTEGVCTTIGRLDSSSDRLFIERLPVNSADDPKFFRAKLTGAYDWLASPQAVVKAAKRWLGGRS